MNEEKMEMNEEKKNTMPETSAEEYRSWWLQENRKTAELKKQIAEMKAEHEEKVKEMENNADNLKEALSDTITELHDAREVASYQEGRADGILEVLGLIHGYGDEEDDDPVEEDEEEDGENAE